MFKRAPYRLPDPRAVTELVMYGVKEGENFYGPSFTAKVIKYALIMLNRHTGESQPKDIKTLDQLTEHLLLKSKLMPPYYVVFWAMLVAEKKLEGCRGVGTRLMEKGIFKKVMENWNGKIKLNIKKALSKFNRTIVKMKVAPVEMGYKKNEDGSIDILIQNCYWLEGCKYIREMSLMSRPDGSTACDIFSLVCQVLREATGQVWDYTILDFCKPPCIARCFILY